MNEALLSTYFGESHAAAYDERWKRMASVNNLLHFIMRSILGDLPVDARILCVGVGTGAELLALAQMFPQWTFLAVEPSPPMLDVCRNKAKEAGFINRCEFHEGYIDTVPETQSFHAATSILVSQFIMDEDKRRDYFRQIAHRVQPGGLLINADLANPFRSEQYESLIELWLRTQTDTKPTAEAKLSCSAWGTAVAVSKPSEIEAMIESSGFKTPILFYQAMFIHAWYAKL